MADRCTYLYVVFLFIILLSSSVSAVLISDQGADVKNSTDQLLTLGNLTIDIYDASSGGNVVYTQTILNAIINGSWNTMINPNLEFGKSYWKDYEINGFDLNFSGNDTLEFKSPLGFINASFVNFSFISTIDVLGNISLGGNLTVRGNATIAGNLTVTGNVTAAYFRGDGSGITGITTTETDPALASNLTNGFSSSVNPLADITQSLGSATKRWFSGWIKNIFAENVTINGNLTVIGNTTITSSLNVSGNVTARYFFGDGSGLTGITTTETDPSLASNLTNGFSSSVNPLADITQSLGSATKRWFMVWSKNSFGTNVTVNGNLTVFGNTTMYGNVTIVGNETVYGNINVTGGNVTAQYFFGNGAGLTGITTSETDPSLASNLTNGFSSSVVPLADITQSLGSATKRWFAGWFKNIFVENITVIGNLTVRGNTTLGNLTVTGNTSLSGSLNVSGNTSARYFYGNISTATFPHSTCSGTDKVTAISSSGVVTCATDQTGGASTQTKWANQTLTGKSQAAISWQEIFQFGIAAGKNYTFDCHFTAMAAATTTGVQFNYNLTGGNITYWEGGFLHPTTVSASLFVRCSGNLSFCQDNSITSVIAGVPVHGWGRLYNTKVGHFNISWRPEVAAAATLEKGGYCILEDIAGGVVS